MRRQLKCCLCKTYGYGHQRGWSAEVLVLAVDPNVRSGPKPWICRNCIKLNSKLSDENFLELIRKAIQQKP